MIVIVVFSEKLYFTSHFTPFFPWCNEIILIQTYFPIKKPLKIKTLSLHISTKNYASSMLSKMNVICTVVLHYIFKYQKILGILFFPFCDIFIVDLKIFVNFCISYVLSFSSISLNLRRIVGYNLVFSKCWFFVGISLEICIKKYSRSCPRKNQYTLIPNFKFFKKIDKNPVFTTKDVAKKFTNS